MKAVVEKSQFEKSESHGEAIAIRGIDIHKAFPIVSSGGAWRILLGLQEAREWFPALKSVSLEVPKGKILGVLGRNGAGKSTLLRVLAGVYAPSAGKVSISGAIASLFELGGLGTRFITGREYADRLLRFQGVRGKRLAKLIEQVREFSELDDFFDRRIYTYSSGMAARLYFSVATAVRKDVFLIDELLSVGDEHFQAKCWRRIRDLLSNGASGVLVTHDWSAVIKLCEQSIILKQGKVAASGSTDGMVAAYLGLARADESKIRLEYPSSEAHAISGNDWNESFHLEVCCEGKIDFGFSIEMLRLGVGWEIMILSNMKEVANGPGKYQITVSIPKMPLVSGTYSLNLFLRHQQVDGKPFSLPLRSWTTGNGIHLHVSGASAQTAVARPPLQWHFDRKGYDAN